MFEGPVTGNIPEVLDNGEVTDGTHVTAGQLALALTPYAQVTDLAVNTAAAGNNAAAIQSLDDRVTAELASKLDSSALAPAIAPLATAAALATTDGQVAAHGSSIAALQSSLTTGLSNKADQSAFDVLEGVVATKSTPDGVDLKLSNYSTTAAMNGSIASANNATLATVAANYGLKTVVDQHSLDAAGGGHQGGQRSPGGRHRRGAGLRAREQRRHHVAAIGEQILAPTDVSLSNWTVRPSSGCSVVLATHTAGVSVDGYTLTLEHRAHLQLDARQRAALRLPLPARHGLQLRGVRVRGRQRLRPIVRQLRGRPGRLEHGQDVLHRAAQRGGEAALWGALPGAGPAQPDGRNGGRLRPPDPGRNPGGRQHGGGGHGGLGAAAEARVPRRRGGRRHAGHPGRGAAGTHAHHARKFPGALQQPELRGLGQLHGGRLPAGGLRHDPERLRLEHRAHLHADAGETLLLRLPVPAGHGLQLGDVRQRGRQRLRGRHRHLPRHARAGSVEHGAPGLLGAAGRNCEAALRSLRRVHPRAGAAVGGHAGPVQHADQGLGLRGRVCLSNGPAGGLAGPHGLGHAGRAHRAGQRGLRPAAVQRRELHRRVHDGRGRLGRHFLRCAHSRHRRRSHAVVHGGRVRQLAEHQRRGQRGPAELRHGNHGQHAHHQQHGQRRELHHGGRRVHGDADGLGRSDGGELRSHRRAHGRHADDHRGGLRGPAGLREPGLHLHSHERRSVDGQRGVRRRDELGHGLRAAALRLQHARRDQHLRLLGRSLPDEELGGLEQAASVQQQRGPRQRPGAAAAGQPEREGLPGAGRRGAPVRAHHDQRRGAGADEEPLHAAVPDHEPEEPRLPRDRGQHGQRGLQHELHEFVGQPGEDGDGGGRRGGAPAALRLRGGQAVQAPGHERRPEAGLRLQRLRRSEVEEPDGHRPVERRHRDDHPRLLSPHQRALGGVQGLPGPAGRGGSLAGPAGAEEQVEKKLVLRPVQASTHPRSLEQAPFWGK